MCVYVCVFVCVCVCVCACVCVCVREREREREESNQECDLKNGLLILGKSQNCNVFRRLHSQNKFNFLHALKKQLGLIFFNERFF